MKEVRLVDINRAESEFILAQFVQAIETYRAQFTLAVSMTTVLIIANVTLIGYALNQRVAGILFVCVLFPLAILLLSRSIYRLSLPIIYTAVSLEQRYGGEGSDWLATTFVNWLGSAYSQKVKEIGSFEDQEDRIDKLRSLSYLSLSWRNMPPLVPKHFTSCT